MKKGRRKKPSADETEVILLRDLAPRANVKGGAGKILFGQRLDDGARAAAGQPGESAGSRPKKRA